MRQFVFLLIAGLILAGLFVLLAPEGPVPAELTPSATAAAPVATLAPAAPAPSPVAAPAGPPTATPAPTPGVKRFRLEVGEQGLVSGPDLIRVRQGEAIELELVSSIRDELHLHGYDLHLHLAPGKTAVLALTADLSGRFEFELHERHSELGVLEVLPR